MDEKNIWKEKISDALNALLKEANTETQIKSCDVVAEIPPSPEMGDLGFPMFPFAKILRKAPPVIAQLVLQKITGLINDNGQNENEKKPEVSAAGPYINVRLDRASFAASLLKEVLDETKAWTKGTSLNGRRIMVEFSSPNTNKPLHLGHLRNDVLGESISRILICAGADVRKVCIINDRGIHICKSMLAYKEKFAGITPESIGKKSDHFVGDCYVQYSKLEKEDAHAIERARELLIKWEAGDAETTALWKKMNDWTVDGIKKTYKRCGVSFDKYYFESQTYLRGKEEVLKGLEKNIFFRAEDGSVQADLTAENLDTKILLRKDGTSLYITQDFGTVIMRHDEWLFDKLIYVVGNEQRYHFQVLFTLLSRLGFDWAKNLYHLSYGMVNLPEGRMKSREGTVVDADDLIDELKSMALNEIRQKEREEAVGDACATAEKIALGALHYFLLQITPDKDMLFNPAESISFNGNTGPYLQYMGARISSLLRRIKNDDKKNEVKHCELLTNDAEWELLKTIADWPQTLTLAAEKINPSVITAYLYEMSKNFSRFYHDCPVLNAEEDLAAARLNLCRAVLRVLKDALELVCIPFLETM
ncbi:arginine--tRNA ligase [Spirochaetia bacterium]|nr:arginine--tRNA ligase [Spirochaetia bacterium]